MKTRLYLDCRSLQVDGKAPLKLGINRKSETAFIPLGISIEPKYWDKNLRTTTKVPLSKWPARYQAEAYINTKRSEIDNCLLRLEADGRLHNLSAIEIRDLVVRTLNPQEERTLLADQFRAYIAKTENKRTKEIYTATLQKITSIGGLEYMDDITSASLEVFYLRLKDSGCKSVNGRNIHMRNIRAVFNYALRCGLTTNYPFRRFTIKSEETSKRSLTLEQLQTLLRMEFKDTRAEYRDMFILSFLLIGINFTDLVNLRDENVVNGRIQYQRAKTHKAYSILFLPEAQAIIDRYKGDGWLLNVRNRYKDTHDYLKNLNAGLKRIKPEPPYNELSTYWARHTWATLAYNELHASIDTISASLGHSYGSKVTQVYINPDERAVDSLNQRMAGLIYGNF